MHSRGYRIGGQWLLVDLHTLSMSPEISSLRCIRSYGYKTQEKKVIHLRKKLQHRYCKLDSLCYWIKTSIFFIFFFFWWLFPFYSGQTILTNIMMPIHKDQVSHLFKVTDKNRKKGERLINALCAVHSTDKRRDSGRQASHILKDLPRTPLQWLSDVHLH